MFEKVFAAVAVAVCAVLLVRLLLGERTRWRFDSALRRGWLGIGRTFRRTGRQARDAVGRPAAERRARRAADDAIRRARDGSWDGNVFRPDSFDGRDRKVERKRRDLH